MATTYKDIRDNDIAATRTKLHEAIPITGTIVSGTYTDNNIKNYAHGMFQSVYDYPFLSSSANHIFDLTVGVGANDALYASVATQQQKKNNIYNQFAQTMVGYDITGAIHQFDADGILGEGSTITQAMFIPFSRLLTKDEIKKESFQMIIGVNTDFADAFSKTIKVYDSGAINNYRVNSPAGEYGLLYAENYAGTPIAGEIQQAGGASPVPVGLVYYQAGMAVLNLTAAFGAAGTADGGSITGMLSATVAQFGGTTLGPTGEFTAVLTGSTIEKFSDDFRTRIQDISFNNTTELNSSIYFCRVGHNDYNYSSNPTYLDGSKIRVKNNSTDTPVAYVTTVGLYSADNELMAVAKLSEPLRKDPTQNYTIRVRLDY
jgi:hypothetical protein